MLGPTASGKTKFACHVADKMNGEIISADSRQIYRHMTIGTGKDIDEYRVKENSIPYHLIDIKDPGYKYNIAEYQEDFNAAYQLVRSNGHLPILCGGSGLYIETALKGNSFLGIPINETLWKNLESASEEKIEELYQNLPEYLRSQLTAKTRKRKIRALEIQEFLDANPDWEPRRHNELNAVIVGIDIEREERRKRITDRLSYRLNNGLIEEVEFLLKNYLTYQDLEYYGLEYKWVGNYLQNNISKKELFEGLNTAIHQFSKRQMTWFRKMENQGFQIHWLPADLSNDEKIERTRKLVV